MVRDQGDLRDRLHRLQQALDRRAIRDVLVRLARATEHADLDLLRSVYHPDATIAYHPDFSGNAWETYERRMRAPTAIDSVGIGDTARSQLVAMHHHVTNHRVELAGDQAWSEHSMIGYHVTRQDDTVYLSSIGERFVDRFERRAGEWRIASRLALHDWSRVEPVGATDPEAARWAQGRMDRSDPSYWPALDPGA